jgi:hypothetical protein
MEARCFVCPGKAKEDIAVLEGLVRSMTPAAKFFQLYHLEALNAGRCAQAATIPPVTVVLAAARAAPRRVSTLALFLGCHCACMQRNSPILLAAALSVKAKYLNTWREHISLPKSQTIPGKILWLFVPLSFVMDFERALLAFD